MLRAIDAQQIIAQITQAEKVQQVQQQHPEMQQRYFEARLSEENRLMQKKIKDAEETRKAIVTDREQRKGKEEHFQGREKKDMQGEGKQKEPQCGSTINITV